MKDENIQTAAPPPAVLAAQEAAEQLGATLLRDLVKRLEELPKPWRDLDQYEQQREIDALRGQVEAIIRAAFDVLFRQQYPACVAQLGRVAFGDTISASIKIARDAVARHELADASGGKIVVLLADPERFLEGMELIRARASQGELFVGVDPAAPGSDETVYSTPPAGEAEADGWVTLGTEQKHARELAKLVELLYMAGVRVLNLDAAQGWTEAQRALAATWARDRWNRVHAPTLSSAEAIDRPWFIAAPTNDPDMLPPAWRVYVLEEASIIARDPEEAAQRLKREGVDESSPFELTELTDEELKRRIMDLAGDEGGEARTCTWFERLAELSPYQLEADVFAWSE